MSIDILKDIAFDERLAGGCAQVLSPDGKDRYISFGEVISIEEERVLLVEEVRGMRKASERTVSLVSDPDRMIEQVLAKRLR